MNYFRLLCIAIILSACAGNTEQHLKDETFETSDFPIDTIKKYSTLRVDQFNLDTLELSTLNTIDTTFFKHWLKGQQVNNVSDFNIPYDEWSRYFFYDFRELKEVALFSIIQNDAVGYDRLYHFTYDKEKRKIISVDLLGQTGKDGRQTSIDLFQYNADGQQLVLTNVSTSDKDIGESDLRQYDSIVTNVTFGKHEATYVVMDSLRKTYTVRTK